MKKIGLIILSLIFVVSTYIKITAVSGNNFPFTMDQGRDLVDIRQMVVSHTPRLVGPTTSINGVLLGPFWYYFLLPPYLFSGGDPQVIMYWQIIWYQISVIFLWWVIKKINKNLAFFIAFLLLLSPTGFNTGRYFWNANAMPMMTAFFFGTFLLTLEKATLLSLLSTGIVAGLSMQIEAAFGILFFPFAFLYLAIKNKKLKQLIYLSSGFLLTLIPQALFELRHQFIMTKVLIAEFTGKAGILGEKLTLEQKLSDRWRSLLSQIINSSHIPEAYIKAIFLISLIIVIFIVFKKAKHTLHKSVSVVSLTFLVFSGLFYLIFSQQLKQWYVLGLLIPITLIIAYALDYLWSTKNKIAMLLVAAMLLFHFTNAISAQSDFIINQTLKPSNDPSNLRNQLTDINWVYQQANGKAFKAYNYIPSVYDYSLNYLYWWYGTKQYGYQPSDVAYLPDQPEYIPGNSRLWTKTKQFTPNDPTFLIIEVDKEMPIRQYKWFGNFSKLCPNKDLSTDYGVRLMELSQCPTNKNI